MRTAVSNIAWNPKDRVAAYSLMAATGVDGLEIAPGLFFFDAEDAFQPTQAARRRALDEVADAGLSLVSMQSLLFGTQGAALFGEPAARSTFMAGMRRAITLAASLDVPNLVFGSPKQRVIPDGMMSADAEAIAIETFLHLGDLAAQAGTQISLEPNPAIYETNFLTSLSEVISLIKRIDHPAIRINFDIGALHANHDMAAAWDQIGGYAALIGHVHLSAPWLAAPKETAAEVEDYKRTLQDAGYTGPFSLEMKEQDADLSALAEAVTRLTCRKEH